MPVCSWFFVFVFQICKLTTTQYTLSLFPQICREFFRITQIDLMTSFRSSLARFTPALLKYYRKKKESAGSEITTLLAPLDDQVTCLHIQMLPNTLRRFTQWRRVVRHFINLDEVSITVHTMHDTDGSKSNYAIFRACIGYYLSTHRLISQTYKYLGVA